MHSAPRQQEMRPCAFCMVLFTPVVPWQEFCKGQHRTDYNRLRGTMGRIVSIRRLRKGKTSITLHFSGPAAESSFKLDNGEYAYVAKATIPHQAGESVPTSPGVHNEPRQSNE